MRKLQVAEFPKSVYRQIETQAARTGHSVEDEIRMRLVYQYNNLSGHGDDTLPARMHWRKEVGCRINWIWRRLTDDGVLPEESGFAHMARCAGEKTAGPLIDCQEGRSDLDFELADRLASRLDIRADWLLCGTGSPFPVTDLDQMSAWDEFFVNGSAAGNHHYELMRVNGLYNDGVLLCFRFEAGRRMSVGRFINLFRVTQTHEHGINIPSFVQFFVYLKSCFQPQQLYSSEYVINVHSPDFIVNALGQHHPYWFTQLRRRCRTLWLERLLKGQRPFAEFDGYDDCLKEIGAAPFLSAMSPSALFGHSENVP